MNEEFQSAVVCHPTSDLSKQLKQILKNAMSDFFLKIIFKKDRAFFRGVMTSIKIFTKETLAYWRIAEKDFSSLIYERMSLHSMRIDWRRPNVCWNSFFFQFSKNNRTYRTWTNWSQLCSACLRKALTSWSPNSKEEHAKCWLFRQK